MTNAVTQEKRNGAVPNPAHARAEYDKATANLSFTKDFRSLDAIIQDRLATAGERVYAWIKRRAWGNYRLFCVGDDGLPVYQRDCVKDTGLHKQTVSTTVKYLQTRGYVRIEGKLMYPVLSPVLGENFQKVSRSRDFLQFVELWKVSRSTDFQELEVARATVERLRKVMRSEYKQWVASRTNGGPTLYRELESKTERNLPAAAESPAPSPAAAVLDALSKYGKTDLDTAERVIDRCREQYPKASVDQILQMIDEKGLGRSNVRNRIALLVDVVPKAFKGFTPKKPKTDPYEEQNIAIWREMLAPGSKYSPEDQEIARQCLRARGKLWDL